MEEVTFELNSKDRSGKIVTGRRLTNTARVQGTWMAEREREEEAAAWSQLEGRRTKALKRFE